MLDRTTVFERGRTNVLSAQLFGIAHAELTSANKIIFGIQRIVRFLAAQGARLACRVHVRYLQPSCLRVLLIEHLHKTAELYFAVCAVRLVNEIKLSQCSPSSSSMSTPHPSRSTSQPHRAMISHAFMP